MKCTLCKREVSEFHCVGEHDLRRITEAKEVYCDRCISKVIPDIGAQAEEDFIKRGILDEPLEEPI